MEGGRERGREEGRVRLLVNIQQSSRATCP